MTESVFVDTGAWIATAVSSDNLHSKASQAMKRLVAHRCLLVTSDFVLSETLTRIRYDAGHKQAVAFLARIDAAIEAGSARLDRIDDATFRAARQTFVDFDDQDFSFVDCTSFALAKSLQIARVFGFDRHFFTMGFQLFP